MDALYFFLIGMTLTGLFLVGVLVFGFAVKYRKEKSPVATQIEGSTVLEATWTIIPLGIFLLTFVWGRAALLPYLQSSDQRHEHIRGRQAVDVEGGAPGRAA